VGLTTIISVTSDQGGPQGRNRYDPPGDLLAIQNHDWDPLPVPAEEPGILGDVYVIDAKNEFSLEVL
jgi:hypothetical protein